MTKSSQGNKIINHLKLVGDFITDEGKFVWLAAVGTPTTEVPLLYRKWIDRPADVTSTSREDYFKVFLYNYYVLPIALQNSYHRHKSARHTKFVIAFSVPIVKKNCSGFSDTTCHCTTVATKNVGRNSLRMKQRQRDKARYRQLDVRTHKFTRHSQTFPYLTQVWNWQ